jgi:uncharacterized Zn-binding protein involved in type VI secretion
MPFSHRNNDSRICGALTIVVGQDFVTVDGQLWSVDNDPNTHGGGQLISSQTWVTIDGKGVIVKDDSSDPDALCFIVGGPHCNPKASGFSNLVEVS